MVFAKNFVKLGREKYTWEDLYGKLLHKKLIKKLDHVGCKFF